MDIVKRNARLIVIILLAIGVIAVMSSNSSNDDVSLVDGTEETAGEVTGEESATENDSPEVGSSDNEEVPQTEVERLQKTETGFILTARSGDNQTSLVRRAIDNHIQTSGVELSAEQKLYVETHVVNSISRNDRIIVGEKFEVSDEKIKSTVDASKNLTEAQIAAWAEYL